MAEQTQIEWTTKRYTDPKTGKEVIIPGATWNGWIGCEKVSPACANCYAERDFDIRKGRVKWGGQAAGGTRSFTGAGNWAAPNNWASAAYIAGHRRLVFAFSLADVFEDWGGTFHDHEGRVVIHREVSNDPDDWDAVLPEYYDPAKHRAVTADEGRLRLFRKIAETSHGLDYLILTKRPDVAVRKWQDCQMAWLERFAEVSTRKGAAGYGPVAQAFGRRGCIPNIWFGFTAENQEWLEARWHHAAQIPVAVKFISAEPLRGPLNLKVVRLPNGDTANVLTGEITSGATGASVGYGPKLSWVISGGESGEKARPEYPGWHRGLRDDCVEAVVPYHFKQFGEWLPLDHAGPEHIDSGRPEANIYPTEKQDHAAVDVREGRAPLPMLTYRVGKKAAGRELDGIEWNQFPAGPLDLIAAAASEA